MMGNYKPRSYMYYFFEDDIAGIYEKLQCGGVSMKDLGNAGCCGIQPLSRANLNEALTKQEKIRAEKLAEAENELAEAQENFDKEIERFFEQEAKIRQPAWAVDAGLRECLQEEVSLAQWCREEARRVPRFCKELGH